MKLSSCWLPLAVSAIALPALATASRADDTTPIPAAPSPTPGATPKPATPKPATPAQKPAAPAEDTITAPEKVINITATRNPRPLSQTASSVTVITHDQIEAKQPYQLSDLLRLAAGVSVSESGTIGHDASVFIRGANSNQTLVLIDGVRATNEDIPFDFGPIPIENIDRIEILRGPGSALYGSDAMGGVINIITRHGQGPLTTSYASDIGPNSTNDDYFNLNGASGKTGISFGATRSTSLGFGDNDGYNVNGGSLRLDRALTSHQSVDFISRESSARLGVLGSDQITPYQVPTPFQTDRTQEADNSVQWVDQVGKQRDQITFGAHDYHLHDNDVLDPLPANASDYQATDFMRSIEEQSSYALGQHTITGGYEFRRERAENSYLNSSATSTTAIFAQDEWHLGKLLLVPGLRREHNTQYGPYTSGRLAGALALDEKTRLKSSYGTGFRAPTFDELYGYGGVPNLLPEKNIGWDAGIERDISKGGVVDATFFENRFKDLIEGYSTSVAPNYFTYLNVDSADVHGLEFSLNQPLTPHLRLIANQTFTKIHSSTPLLRRPNFDTTFDLLGTQGKWSEDLGILAQGQRLDYDANNATDPDQVYGGYSRFDLTLNYKLHKDLAVYLRSQNLLDHQYEEVAGYPAAPFNFVIGIKSTAF